MKRVCAWCGTVISIEDADCPVTHGICKRCKESEQLNLRPRSVAAFLDRLAIPVVAMDAENRVLAANQLACERIGKTADEATGRFCGDLLDCVRTRLPGGCGKTEECPSCTVRKALQHTYDSGEACRTLVACVESHNPNGAFRKELVIATEKIDDLVLLRVDEIRRFPADAGGQVNDATL